MLISPVVSPTVAGPAEAVTSKKKLALQEELFAKEKSVWDAYKRQDAKALNQLLAENYYAVEDADGETMTKTDALKSVASLDLEKYEIKDLVLIEINDGSAIVRYKVKIEGADGHHKFVPHWSLVSSVWVKRGGKWQNLMYQETKIGG